MHACVCGWVRGCVCACTRAWIVPCVCAWMVACMCGLVHAWMGACVDGCMRGWVCAWMGAWVGEWASGCMRGCVGAWIVPCVGTWIDACHPPRPPRPSSHRTQRTEHELQDSQNRLPASLCPWALIIMGAAYYQQNFPKTSYFFKVPKTAHIGLVRFTPTTFHNGESTKSTRQS